MVIGGLCTQHARTRLRYVCLSQPEDRSSSFYSSKRRASSGSFSLAPFRSERNLDERPSARVTSHERRAGQRRLGLGITEKEKTTRRSSSCMHRASMRGNNQSSALPPSGCLSYMINPTSEARPRSTRLASPHPPRPDRPQPIAGLCVRPVFCHVFPPAGVW